MKHVLWTLVLLLGTNSFAVGVSSRCVKRVLKYRTAIDGSAAMVREDFIAAKQSQDRLSASDFQQLADSYRLRSAIENLAGGKSLDDRQIQIVNGVCALKTFNADSVSVVLEHLDDGKRVELSKSCRETVQGFSHTLRTSAAQRLSLVGELREATEDLNVDDLQVVANNSALLEGVDAVEKNQILTGRQIKVLNYECMLVEHVK